MVEEPISRRNNRSEHRRSASGANIRDISEKYLVTCGVYLGIVQRVELSTKVVVQKNRSVMRSLRVDQSNAWWQWPSPRVDKQKIPMERASSSIRHLNRLRKVKLTAY